MPIPITSHFPIIIFNNQRSPHPVSDRVILLGGTIPVSCYAASRKILFGTGRGGRVELFPDTYLRRPIPAMELMSVGMLAD
jgi:hypothetical protein